MPASLLRANEKNPRYFANEKGEAVVFTGFHTWNNLVDMRPSEETNPFDFDHYLDTLSRLGHNHIRLWTWNALCTWNPRDRVDHFPWLRTGPGTAVDGQPRFDLTQLDETYFSRLRQRVQQAADRGIYVGVMLFEAWGANANNSTPLSWHVFAGWNNINGIDVSAEIRDNWMVDWMAMNDDAVLKLQENLVRRLVEELNEFDNVVWEVCNEAGTLSYRWQEHWVTFVRALEKDLPKQHLIGISGGMNTRNPEFYGLRADYLAPEGWAPEGKKSPYCDATCVWGDEPEQGTVPILLDTDHLWGIGGTVDWAWKSFLRGYHVLYMDRVDDFPSAIFEHPWWPDPTNLDLRAALGVIQRVAQRLDLNECLPTPAWATSEYCLAGDGSVVAWAAAGETLGLALEKGPHKISWIDPVSGSESIQEYEAQGVKMVNFPAQDRDFVILAQLIESR
ncbi:MAG: DUF6298 domain-containing protein [Fimbriimonadaceae bacterium]|jgi:hypothetical protein|nr:DUF6298 domain-containing protein [Fimbriimonadaceae bacterium]